MSYFIGELVTVFVSIKIVKLSAFIETNGCIGFKREKKMTKLDAHVMMWSVSSCQRMVYKV